MSPGGEDRVRLVAVDLDGVVWLAGAVLPDAAKALVDVVERGLDLRYVSNNSTAHREAVSERLAAAGLPAGADRVLTSGYVTARWLRQRLPQGAPVLVVGEPGLLRELTEAGLAPVHAGGESEAPDEAAPDEAAPGGATRGAPRTRAVPARGAAPAGGAPDAAATSAAPARGAHVGATSSAVPAPGATPAGGAFSEAAPAGFASGGAGFKAVVVGMDRSFSFTALAQAQAAILAGALFVGTNPDPTFPTPTGLLPGAGSVVAAVATAAERQPVFMGKPGLALAEVLAEVTGIPAAQTLFIGDRISTDIGMGRKAGMITALVLTGVSGPQDLERARAEGSAELPDHVLATLADLPALLDALS